MKPKTLRPRPNSSADCLASAAAFDAAGLQYRRIDNLGRVKQINYDLAGRNLKPSRTSLMAWPRARRDGSSAAGTNGQATTLEVKKSATGDSREAFLRFDLSSFASVKSAKLRLFGKLSDASAPSVQVGVFGSSNIPWSATGVNWNNRPTATSTLPAFTVAGMAVKWYDIDVSAYAKAERAAGRKVITLALEGLQSLDPVAQFNCDEAATGRPELVVT